MKTTIKLKISIDQQRIGYYGMGEINIIDMMFSESSYKLMDADELITEVKQAIKMLKGFNMITITLTDDQEFSLYPKVIHEVRFTDSYGDVRMAFSNGHYFDNWNDAKVKDVYDNIRVFVKNANILQLGKLKQSANTEVANA